MFEWHDLATLLGVVWLDVALAADNAIAVGLAAASLPAAQQRRAVTIGIIAALVLRIAFALVAVQLLAIKGLLLVGGLVLFWVAWRMWQDLESHAPDAAHDASASAGPAPPATFGRALMSIIVADVSMSLDNVLSVAALARHSPEIMAIGLVLSVILMGVAASFIANLVGRHRWIAWVGIAVIVFAAIRMVWEDAHAIWPTVAPPLPSWMGAAHPPA